MQLNENMVYLQANYTELPLNPGVSGLDSV